MAATFIPALVIKHNNDVYLNTDTLAVGTIMSIPTPGSGAVIDGDFWAKPINDNVVAGFDYIPCAPTDVVPPSAQSFHVFRLTNRFGNDVWYVNGITTGAATGSPSSAGYIQAAADAECCSATPRSLSFVVPVLAPCQRMCEFDANNNYFGEFAFPTLTGNLRYYAYGYYNNVLLPAGTATGYASKAALITFLNSGNWGAIGTWTFDAATNANSLKVTQTGGSGANVLCVSIITVNPSA